MILLRGGLHFRCPVTFNREYHKCDSQIRGAREIREVYWLAEKKTWGNLYDKNVQNTVKFLLSPYRSTKTTKKCCNKHVRPVDGDVPL